MQNKTQGIDALENSDARDSRFNNKKLTIVIKQEILLRLNVEIY